MHNLDLLIVHSGATHGIYGVLGNDLVAVEPPLWCRLIAGYVRDVGITVKIVDAEALHYGPEDVHDVVVKENPRLVCIAVYGHQPSASTQQMVGASAIATYLKNSVRTSKTPLIMVGGHVSALPALTMQQEAIDFACVGEGPVTIACLLAGTETENVPGLVWRDASNPNQVYVNPSAPLLDVNKLHGDAWDLLPMEKYRAHNWQCMGDLGQRQPYASIYTSLGCPYKCSFCCINAPFETNQYRMRDPARVVEEIVKLYSEYGIKTFKITDEMFVLNERHYTAICNGLIELGMGPRINIWAYARVDTVKPHTLDLFRNAGIRWLALGIESGSKYVRDGAQKRLKNDDIRGVVKQIQQAGINVIGNYIFGLPDDDFVSMQETLELALEMNTEFANFYSAMAYPGSKLYTEAREKGWILPETWAGYSQHNRWCRPLDTQHITAKDVLAFRDLAFQTYFTSPVYLNMIKYKFGDEAFEHVLRMTRYKLERNLLKEKEVA